VGNQAPTLFYAQRPDDEAIPGLEVLPDVLAHTTSLVYHQLTGRHIVLPVDDIEVPIHDFLPLLWLPLVSGRQDGPNAKYLLYTLVRDVDQVVHHLLYNGVFLDTDVELCRCVNQPLNGQLFLLFRIEDVRTGARLPMLFVHCTHLLIVGLLVGLECFRDHM